MKLALFFVKGVSLKVYGKIGTLDREIKPYQELAKYFDEILFLTYDRKELALENIKVLDNKWNVPSLIYSFLLPFLYWKELKQVDVLKTDQMFGSWTAIIAKFFFQKKLVIRCGYQLSFLVPKKGIKRWKLLIIQLLERFVYRNADAIIVASKKDKKYIEEKYNILPKKIKYIPNYIDTGLFRPLDIGKENRICFVGRLEEEKNLFNLIKAVSGLGEKLVIFGSGSLGPKLRRLAGSNVEFKGNISNKDLPMELNKSKLFILPSLYEGCPKVLLEAMACEMPVIGTNTYGINEIIKDKGNGYLCGTDVLSIRKAIIEVLSNKGLQKKLSKNARKTILQNFSLEKILEKEKNIYDNLYN